jgi:tRNA pseudouridine55 synthase
MNGFVVINKPAGVSSHGVVNAVRRAAGQRSVGHAGTLDPLASGVMIALLGKTASLSQYVMRFSKLYAAEIVFGCSTASDDLETAMCNRGPVEEIAESRVRLEVSRLEGQLTQVPPAYSAVTVDGVRSYRAVRSGQEVTMPPRIVLVHSMTVVTWKPPALRILTRVGSGTYIRALARDLGTALESRAYLHSLIRLSVGGFDISQALALDSLDATSLQAAIREGDELIDSWPAVVLSAHDARYLGHGREVAFNCAVDNSGVETPIRAYSEDGRLLALTNPTGHRLRPLKVFAT